MNRKFFKPVVASLCALAFVSGLAYTNTTQARVVSRVSEQSETQEDNLAYLVVGAAVLVAAALAVEDSAESS
jgi:hypothetical protein